MIKRLSNLFPFVGLVVLILTLWNHRNDINSLESRINKRENQFLPCAIKAADRLDSHEDRIERLYKSVQILSNSISTNSYYVAAYIIEDSRRYYELFKVVNELHQLTHRGRSIPFKPLEIESKVICR